MIFGVVAIGAAEGAVLAHTHRLPGRVIKKGSVLDAGAVDALRAAGRTEVIAARLGPGDVGEDAAAHRLADALRGPHTTRTRAATGRVNLLSDAAGLLRVDRQAVDAFNAVDEAVTVATLRDYEVVAPGTMLATIKVIPFTVPGPVLDAAVARAAPLRVLPFRPLRVALVLSTAPGLKQGVLDGTVEATAGRVAGLGGTLLPHVTCPHDARAIADALDGFPDADILLVAGASAVVDRRDVGPAGIVAAGGEILHFGMPVDPGNLICLGRIGLRPALVLPGCARSPQMNGIDWVLSRLFAGVPVDGQAIAAMGVGGLLKDVSARPLPRARAAPTVAAVVLAAGRSSRMAPHHKLLLPDARGVPMLARVVDQVLDSRARPVIVVTGYREADVRAALPGRPLRFVHAPDFADGLSASLRAGIAAVPDSAAAALVCLGDMPEVSGATIDGLLDAYDPVEGRAIVAPTAGGALGNPVLWDRRFFPELMDVSGDRGGRGLLQRHADQVAEVETDAAVLRDYDTQEALPAEYRASLLDSTA